MDSKIVHLPNLEGLVVLNIPSWGGGLNPWVQGNEGDQAPKQDFNDGLMEVFALESSYTINMLYAGLSGPIRLGQCSTLTIQLRKTTAVQIDGEPWE